MQVIASLLVRVLQHAPNSEGQYTTHPHRRRRDDRQGHVATSSRALQNASFQHLQ